MSVSVFIERAAAFTVGLLYDERCPVCEQDTDNLKVAPFCRACWDAGIARYEGPSCSVCARPFASKFSTVCAECLRQPPWFHEAHVYGLYEGTLRQAIHALKFKGRKSLAAPLASLMQALTIPKADCIIPVPTGMNMFRTRGFNQSLLLGKRLGQQMGIPLVYDVLYKRKETQPQVGLTRIQREQNLRGAFDCRRELKGMHIILIDDVITTGATANACSRSLKRAGASRITLTALARTY